MLEKRIIQWILLCVLSRSTDSFFFTGKTIQQQSASAGIVLNSLFAQDESSTNSGSSKKQPLSSPSRWMGNSKPSIKKLSDIPKAKKHTLELTTANNGTGERRTKLLEKNKYESLQHVLTKALLWKLFQEEYPDIQIELDIGDPDFLPDAISLSSSSTANGGDTPPPLFWGESGRMSLEKALDLADRYPSTHIVHLRWGMTLNDYVPDYAPALSKVKNRTGRYTFGAIQRKEVWDFFHEGEDGVITVQIEKKDVEWLELSDYVK